MVYDADPAGAVPQGRRRAWWTVVPPQRPLGVRAPTPSGPCPSRSSCSSWGYGGAILGYTAGNDVTARDVEGVNPLYLPQAKLFAGAGSIGPAVYVLESHDHSYHLTLRVTDEWGRIVFEDETFTAKMRRSFTELVEWLLIDNPVPPGSVLLDGVPASSHPTALRCCPDTSSRSTSPRSARSSNPVVRASELIEKEPADDRDADRRARPELRRRRVARERVRRDLREAQSLAAVGGHGGLRRPRPRTMRRAAVDAAREAFPAWAALPAAPAAPRSSRRQPTRSRLASSRSRTT